MGRGNHHGQPVVPTAPKTRAVYYGQDTTVRLWGTPWPWWLPRSNRGSHKLEKLSPQHSSPYNLVCCYLLVSEDKEKAFMFATPINPQTYVVLALKLISFPLLIWFITRWAANHSYFRFSWRVQFHQVQVRNNFHRIQVGDSRTIITLGVPKDPLFLILLRNRKNVVCWSYWCLNVKNRWHRKRHATNGATFLPLNFCFFGLGGTAGAKECEAKEAEILQKLANKSLSCLLTQ